MTKDIVRRLARFGVSASVAIAKTYGAAHVVAGYVRRRAIVVEHGALEAALADLPVPALRLPDDVADGPRTLGLSRIGYLLRASRAPLTQRFWSYSSCSISCPCWRMSPIAIGMPPPFVGPTQWQRL